MKSGSASDRFAVICHNERVILSGRLLDSNASGCDVAIGNQALFPAFGIRAPVVLNILDESKRASVNVMGRAISARREDDVWIYSFSWKRKPALLTPRTSGSNYPDEIAVPEE